MQIFWLKNAFFLHICNIFSNFAAENEKTMRNLPTVTKYLLLANLVMWLLDSSLQGHGVFLSQILGLWPVASPYFKLWQPLTYMFMHANFSHLFCNMFAVLMFGPTLERTWGEKKFLTYYLICGLGAALTQAVVWALIDTTMAVTIGASGAVFGILLAFGWLFPEVEMFLLFIPIPIRSRTFVLLYALFELMAGIGGLSLTSLSADNVAHFAHLGGMLFGWLILLWWRNEHKMPWHKWSRRHPRINSMEEKDKDYSGYHYQKRV